jgi:hypothetical protein
VLLCRRVACLALAAWGHFANPGSGVHARMLRMHNCMTVLTAATTGP